MQSQYYNLSVYYCLDMNDGNCNIREKKTNIIFMCIERWSSPRDPMMTLQSPYAHINTIINLYLSCLMRCLLFRQILYCLVCVVVHKRLQ